MPADGYRCSFCQKMATGGITGTTKTADGGLVYICPEDIELTYQMLREMKDE